MLDPFDYKEPGCAECGGHDFYYFNPDKQQGSVPIQNIIEKLDSFLHKEQYDKALELLKYWLAEASELRDDRGALSILSELMGLSRRIGDRDGGLSAVEQGFALIEKLGLHREVSAATIWLNGATTLKAFGRPQKAMVYYKKAEAIYEHKLQQNDALFGGLYNNMALAYADLGDCDSALEYYNRAIAVMKQQPNGQPDIAITWVNMADMYNAMPSGDSKEDNIERCLNTALAYLNDPDIPHDGYYAFVCRKCAPTFGYYGYFLVKNDLNSRADEIYERNRTF